MSSLFLKNCVDNAGDDVKALIGVETNSIIGLDGVNYEMNYGLGDSKAQGGRHDVDTAAADQGMGTHPVIPIRDVLLAYLVVVHCTVLQLKVS